MRPFIQFRTMLHISVLTIHPEAVRAYLGLGIMQRASAAGVLEAQVHDLRDYTADPHRTVDDTPYGGGPGMVMKPEPIARAIDGIKADGLATTVIMTTPQGRPFNQAVAEELSASPKRLLFICGRYEGIDDRVRQEYADDEISIGDYVMTGGELAALVIIDVAVRLLPGAVGDADSLKEESFTWGLLDYPHYTRPARWRGREVPSTLLSGNHAGIRRWRRKEAIRATLKNRPDLMEGARLSEEDLKIVREIKEDG